MNDDDDKAAFNCSVTSHCLYSSSDNKYLENALRESKDLLAFVIGANAEMDWQLKNKYVSKIHK